MSRPVWRHLARVTIELTAPMAIRSGRSGDVLDTVVVRDANGLPALPGSSLAGALKAAWADHEEAGEATPLFGRTDVAEVDEDGEDRSVGVRSRLHVSWGAIHDSGDRPVAAMLAASAIGQDEVLQAALAPLVRDRVRLNHRGAVDHDGKFDTSAVATGHRFSFELLVEGREGRGELDALLGLLASGRIRLGAGTRSGFGSFSLRRVRARSFDLRQAADLDAFLDLDPDLASPAPALRDLTIPTANETDAEWLSVSLTASEPLLVGGGAPRGIEHRDQLPDLCPLLERRVAWSADKGSVTEDADVVIPGTAIKGTLRHRTAFHLRCARQQWAESEAVQALARSEGARDRNDPWAPDRLDGLDVLFGSVHPAADSAGGRTKAGCVFVPEVRVPVGETSRRVADHIALDRFTGGVMRSALFLEDAIVLKRPVTVRIRVSLPKSSGVPADALEAFRRAIEDLAEGRLNLGGGFGRGRGRFRGSVSGNVATVSATEGARP